MICKNKTILVLGGTGAMGSHAVDILSGNNNFVYVTSRQQRNDRKNVKYLLGNAKNISFLKEVLFSKQWDVIIDFMIYSIQELEDRIDQLLSATKHYIFISSARVYADSVLLTEDSPRLLDCCNDTEYLNSNDYAIVKAQEENILLESSKRNWTIVRPSLTYAENRLQLGAYEKENWLYRVLKGRSIVFSKDLLSKYYTLTYGKDVSEGIASLAASSKALGEIVHVVQNQACSWEEILTIYLDVLEKRLGKRPNLKLTEKAINLEIPSQRNQIIYGRYFNRRFDNTKIAQFVNVSEWKTPKEGLTYCLNCFLDQPSFGKIDWVKEAYIDRAVKEWTPLHEISGGKQKLRYLVYRLGIKKAI